MQDPRIKTDRDFIIAPEYGNSLNKLLEDRPDGLTVSAICKALQINSDEYDTILASAMKKLRDRLK